MKRINYLSRRLDDVTQKNLLNYKRVLIKDTTVWAGSKHFAH